MINTLAYFRCFLKRAYRVREFLWPRRTMIETYKWWKSNTTFSRVMIVFGAFCLDIKKNYDFSTISKKNHFYFVRWSSDFCTAQIAPSRKTEKQISFLSQRKFNRPFTSTFHKSMGWSLKQYVLIDVWQIYSNCFFIDSCSIFSIVCKIYVKCTCSLLTRRSQQSSSKLELNSFYIYFSAMVVGA